MVVFAGSWLNNLLRRQVRVFPVDLHEGGEFLLQFVRGLHALSKVIRDLSPHPRLPLPRLKCCVYLGLSFLDGFLPFIVYLKRFSIGLNISAICLRIVDIAFNVYLYPAVSFIRLGVNFSTVKIFSLFHRFPGEL